MNKAISQLLTRLKHLRGQHDQRDHAWNRGMGGGGAGGSGKRGGGAGVELGPNQMGPLLTTSMYRQQRQQLQQQLRDGVITRAEMQAQLQNLRGITAEPSRRDSASVLLASRRNSPLYNLNKKVDFGEDTGGLTKEERLQEMKEYRESVYDKQEEMMTRINELIAQAAQSPFYTDNIVNTAALAPAESGGTPWVAVNEIIKAYRPIRALAQTLEYLNKTGKITFPDSVDERDIGIGNTMALDTSVLDTLVQQYRSEITEFLNENFDTTVTNGFNAFINPNRSESFLSDIAIPKEILIAYNDLVDHVDVASMEIGMHISELAKADKIGSTRDNPVILLQIYEEINKKIAPLREKFFYSNLPYPEKEKLEKHAKTLMNQIKKNEKELLDLESQVSALKAKIQQHKISLIKSGIYNPDAQYDAMNEQLTELQLKIEATQKSLDTAKEKRIENTQERTEKQDKAFYASADGKALRSLEERAIKLVKEISQLGSSYFDSRAEFLHEIFSSLAHPNPYQNTTIERTFDVLNVGTRTPEEVVQVEAARQRIIKDTMSMFPNIPLPSTSKYERMGFEYNPTQVSMLMTTGTMRINNNVTADGWSHETIHFMQMVFNELHDYDMSYRLAPWIEKRIEREELQPLSSLIRGYAQDSAMGYEDAVDTAYTLRYYGATGSFGGTVTPPSTADILQKPNFANNFYEIQTTAFDDLWKADQRVDRELLSIALSSIFFLSADENIRKIQKKLFDMLYK
jgi:hypothetical protein